MPRLIDLTDALLSLNGGINDDVSFDPLEQLTLLAPASETMKLTPAWTATAQQWYDLIVIADGVTNYFKFDEPSAATAVWDSSPSNRGVSAALSGGVLLGSAGKMPAPNAAALFFYGSPGWLSPNATILSPAGAFALEVWVNLSALPAAGNIGLILANGTGAAAGTGFRWYVTSTGAVTLLVNGAAYSTTGTLLTNAWYHVVFSYSAGTLSRYINNALDGTTSATISVPASAGTSQGIGGDGTVGNFIGNAYLDELAYYRSTALTAAQVGNHFAAGTNAAVKQSTWGGSAKWGLFQYS